MKNSSSLLTLSILASALLSSPFAVATTPSTGNTPVLHPIVTLPPSPILSTPVSAVAEGCAVPQAPTGHTYYVDPVNGKISNDGSQAHPWDTLQNVLAKEKTVIKGGDTINLMSGNYGAVKIANMVNSDFVTFQAAPGQKPVLTLLVVSGSEKLIIKGLKIQSLKNGLVGINNRSKDIIFTNNSLSSQDSVDSWTQADWAANASYGISVQGRPDVVDAGSPLVNGVPQSHHTTSCITISNNSITNVKGPVGIFADHSLFTGNSIDNYAWDAVDYAGNWLTISHNQTTNVISLNDGMHVDCYQGFLPKGDGWAAATFSNVTIDSNICIRQTNPQVKFTGSFQGIDNFDGSGFRDWYNLKVTNNFIVTNQSNCIAFGGVHDSSISNNTCLADGIKTVAMNNGSGALPVTAPGNVSQIKLSDYNHYSNKTSNTTVANNVATGIVIAGTDPTDVITGNVASQGVDLYLDGAERYYKKPGTYSGNIFDLNMDSYFTSVTSTMTPLGPMTVYNTAWKAGSPYIGKGASISNPVSAASAAQIAQVSAPAAPVAPVAKYKGTIRITANARQDGSPKLEVLVNGTSVATQAITADVHTGQTATYTVSYASVTPPKTVDLKLVGYSATQTQYVSLNLWGLTLNDGTKTVDLNRQSPKKLISGDALSSGSGVVFYTNGSEVEFSLP